ncbi:16356_t:CDS:2 [Entrophospora sp. SA101]|nr:16356_t:CDS:2 [Entrophospora sp. SA101]
MSFEEELRKKKLQGQTKIHQNPFQITKFSRNIDLRTIIQQFSHFSREELVEKNIQAKAAGRILRLRNFGNLIFALLNDQEASIQLMVNKNEKFKELDIGDIIGIEGVVCKSQKGELSIKVNDFVLLNLIINQQNRKILIQRFQIINSIREFLNQRGFIEVETPILVSAASGAQAKPFITHHNKLQRDFYLRIATEIPLKMLLVGGLEKVYEIGRIFRNEGIDARHNPEFTTIEVYQAYENAEYMMELTKEVFQYLVKEVLKKEEIEFNSHVINLKNSFHKLSMVEAIKEHVNIDKIKAIILPNSLPKNCSFLPHLYQELNLQYPRFLALLKRVWKNDKLKEVLVEEGKISTENTICLLTGSPHNIEERLKTALAEKHFSKNELIVFVVGISSAHGGEVKTANILDCLYRKKGEVLNFSRSETFSLGTSFTDLKLLLEISIAKKALQKSCFNYHVYNIRNWAIRGQVDDYIYGGGSGMLLKIDCLVKTLAAVYENHGKDCYVILLSPQGKRFTQKDVERLIQKKNLVFICGHYEGIDERVNNYIDEQISVGDFVTSGGEVPALLITETLIRALPGVLSPEAYQNETFQTENSFDFASYTRPAIFRGQNVPEVLLSGNHSEIQK